MPRKRKFSPFLDRVRARLTEEAVAKGATAEEVAVVLDEMDTAHPILDWLKSGGFEFLLNLLMSLLAKR